MFRTDYCDQILQAEANLERKLKILIFVFLF